MIFFVSNTTNQEHPDQPENIPIDLARSLQNDALLSNLVGCFPQLSTQPWLVNRAIPYSLLNPLNKNNNYDFETLILNSSLLKTFHL